MATETIKLSQPEKNKDIAGIIPPQEDSEDDEPECPEAQPTQNIPESSQIPNTNYQPMSKEEAEKRMKILEQLEHIKNARFCAELVKNYAHLLTNIQDLPLIELQKIRDTIISGLSQAVGGNALIRISPYILDMIEYTLCTLGVPASGFSMSLKLNPQLGTLLEILTLKYPGLYYSYGVEVAFLEEVIKGWYEKGKYANKNELECLKTKMSEIAQQSSKQQIPPIVITDSDSKSPQQSQKTQMEDKMNELLKLKKIIT